jgi:hypothetical protein
LALAAIPERDRVLEELVRKLPTGDSVLALSDRELDRTLLSCFVERVTNAHGPLPGPRFFSAGELENLYPVGINFPAARLQELNDRLMESCQRLLTGGYVMPAVGQYGGSMTVTAKGRKGLPPELDYNAISAALWVLECETSCKQGTAFALEDVGLVSCEHVLGPDTRAFKSTAPSQKFAVTVVARHQAIDLAIIKIDGEMDASIHRGDDSVLEIGDEITIAGFPNYRLGDSGTMIPGEVAGFRPVSGIRRILVSASIVAGGSGGPAVNSTGEVIGVAVTGADGMETVGQTENHGVIPIAALDHIAPRGPQW